MIESENEAKAVATYFGWWRKDLPKGASEQYWRDVHGVWAARTPGFQQYRQFHLDRVDPDLLAHLTAVLDTNLPDDDQPDGIAHIMYTRRWFPKLLRMPFATKQADIDEAHFVSRNTFQLASLPESRTVVDAGKDPTFSGLPRNPRFVLAFKRDKAVGEGDFRTYLAKTLCEPWSQSSNVSRLRVDMLGPNSEPAPIPGSAVGHSWEVDKQYHAWIDVELGTDAPLSSLFAPSVGHAKYVSAIHAYPVREVYTLVYDGKPTLVGLRGYGAARLIETMGADNQRSKKLLKGLYGKDIRRRRH